MTKAERLLMLCRERGLTLSTAESCTGGAIAACITAIPGASDCFMGSIVSYSNEAKIKILGVSPVVLQNEGAVSEAVAISMLEGILKILNTDLAVAVTGIAGPGGGTAITPIGTVWLAFGGKNIKTQTENLLLNGSRQSIIAEASVKALKGLIGLIT